MAVGCNARLIGPGAGAHAVAVHRSGDVSGDRCGNCGPRLATLGNVLADANGHASLVLQRPAVSLADIVGRSVVVYGDADADDGNAEASERAACAVIARSAGAKQNSKRICTCDGTTIWESTAP